MLARIGVTDTVDVDFDGETLCIDGRRHDLDRPIGDVVVADGTVIVRFELSTGHEELADVVGIDTDGNRQWEIAEPDHAGARASGFKTLRTGTDGIQLKNGDSFEYRLDPSDGSIEQIDKWDR